MAGRKRAREYEEHPGAAAAPLACGYARRRPEQSVLHQVVREHLATALAQASLDGPGLPRYVEQELSRYLSCGILSDGFCRVECTDCGEEMLVGFSCKGRGFCPSCCGRRMNDTAAHLVDRVLPRARYRQWVLSYPRKLRLLFARDATLARDSATIFLREVFRWQRARAKQQAVRKPQVGAVCFTQRFGSRLDLNVHHHAVLPDGVFALDDAGAPHFVELAAPSDEELEKILVRIVRKTLARLERAGEREDVDALGAAQLEAVQTTLLAIGARRPKRLSALLEGFSLEAGTHVNATNRDGLEHLCRYGLRPPLAKDRLSIAPNGRVVIALKRPMYDGTTEIAYEPVAFVRRLAAIVPPPRAHLTRYFGVFAPASKVRVSAPAVSEEKSEPRRVDGAEKGKPELRPRRLDWAALLQRVFEVDVRQPLPGLRAPLRSMRWAAEGGGVHPVGRAGATDPRAAGHRRDRAARGQGSRAARAARLGRLRRTGPSEHLGASRRTAGGPRCARVLPHPKSEFLTGRAMKLGWRSGTDGRQATAIHERAEGGHSSRASRRQEAGVRRVREARCGAGALLLLAEAVL